MSASDMPAESQPEYTSFGCTLCGTWLSFRVKHVGKKTKCPDCGTVNLIPPPAPKKVTPTPAAMSGKQFELWGVDEAPLPQDQATSEPVQIPVTCKLCGTLMYAREEHLGKKAKCPDCGTATLIVRPKAKPASGPVGVPEGEEYQLDPASAPTPRPVPKPVALRDAEHREASKKAAEERAQAGGKKRLEKPKKKRASLREQPVKFPLVQRLPAMLLTAPVLVRWALLSLLLAIALVSFSALFGGNRTLQVYFTFVLIISGVFATFWLAAAAPLWVSILTESADGHDELYEPPGTDFVEWMGALVYVVAATAASAIPAGLLGKLLVQLLIESYPHIRGLTAIFVGSGWLLAFPVAILSSLEQGSAMAVFSPKIGKSLLTCFTTWLLLYLETVVLVVSAAAASGWLVLQSPRLAMIAAPLLVAATLFYFRLLGRLAWQLSELTTLEGSSESGVRN